MVTFSELSNSKCFQNVFLSPSSMNALTRLLLHAGFE
jgi:hypothetical protein